MLDSAFHFRRADEWLYEPAGLKPDNRARMLALKAWQVRHAAPGLECTLLSAHPNPPVLLVPPLFTRRLRSALTMTRMAATMATAVMLPRVSWTATSH